MDEIKIQSDLKLKYSDLMRVVDVTVPFTLRTILEICVNPKSEITLDVMGKLLRCHYIKEYWEEACSQDFIDDGLIDYLQISWIGDIYGEDLGGENYWHFSGIGKLGVVSDDVKEFFKKHKKKYSDYRESYALEFSQLYKLADYQIKISDQIQIYDHTKKSTKKNTTIVIPLRPRITLMELLFTIFWELSFYGNIKSRNSKLEHLNTMCEELDADIATGASVGVPINDVLEKIRKKIKSKK